MTKFLCCVKLPQPVFTVCGCRRPRYSTYISDDRATPKFVQSYFVGQGHTNITEGKVRKSRGTAWREWLQNQIRFRVKRIHHPPEVWVSHLIRAGLSRGEYQALCEAGDSAEKIKTFLKRLRDKLKKTGKQNPHPHRCPLLASRYRCAATHLCHGPLSDGLWIRCGHVTCHAHGQTRPRTRPLRPSVNAFANWDSRVYSLFEDWKPEGWLARANWEIKCIVNWLRGGTRKRPVKSPSTRYLKGFELPVLTPPFPANAAADQSRMQLLSSMSRWPG